MAIDDIYFLPTCLLGAEVLERIPSRVCVQQQDGEGQIGVSWNDCAVLEVGLDGRQKAWGTKRINVQCNIHGVRCRTRTTTAKVTWQVYLSAYRALQAVGDVWWGIVWLCSSCLRETDENNRVKNIYFLSNNRAPTLLKCSTRAPACPYWLAEL